MDCISSLYDSKLLVGNYYPEATAYYFKEWKNFKMNLHSHERAEIMYVIKGSCIVEISKTSYHMKNGEFIIIDSKVPHRLIVSESTPCRMLNIEFVFIEKSIPYPSIKELFKSTHLIKFLLGLKQDYLLLKDSDEIYYTLKSLILQLDKNESDCEIIKQILFSQILIKTGQFAEEMYSNNLAGSFYVKKALGYLHSHYDYNINVNDIASYVNIHPVYLHRIFKQHIGSTIVEYLTKIRIEKSKMFLANTEFPVTEISSYIGLSSIQYFTYMFKKHTGLTPLQYRKQSCLDNHSK